MYELKNGILYQEGKPIIALGVSYYASFHPAKYPVPSDGDRFGEMRKDVQRIKEAGFQQIRTAALGDIKVTENDKIEIETPFIDALVDEAAKAGLTTSIRLQGYVMNLHGYEGYAMRDQNDKEMGMYWADFLRSSLFHKGMIEDNLNSARELAAHFANMPEMLSFQIYNEPHYPGGAIYDYHPLTVAAYKKWLSEQGLPEKDPPRQHPMNTSAEDIQEWIRWRRFSNIALNGFMNDTAVATSEGAPGVATYTDMTDSVMGDHAAWMGIDYFANAKGPMDLVGITSYVHLEGGDAYHALSQYAAAESAAALHGKHAWNIEVDARSKMPARKLHEEVYAQLAAGFKGLNFYEWRGDYPDPNSPNPDNCGFIFCDGSKTGHYDRSMEMIRFVNKYSTLFAQAEKIREGVAVLFSETGILFADAVTGFHANLYTRNLQAVYHDLRRAGICADFVETSDLEENKFGVKVLFVPCEKRCLNKKEIAEIEAFIKNGGKVYYMNQRGTFNSFIGEGWWDWDVQRLNSARDEFRGLLEVEDVLDKNCIVATAKTNNRHLFAGAQSGDGYALIYLFNTDPARKIVSDAILTTTLSFKQATFLSPDREISLNVDKYGNIILPDVDEGGVVLLK